MTAPNPFTPGTQIIHNSQPALILEDRGNNIFRIKLSQPTEDVPDGIDVVSGLALSLPAEPAGVTPTNGPSSDPFEMIRRHWSLLFEPGDNVCIGLIHSTEKTASGQPVIANICTDKPLTQAAVAKLVKRNELENIYIAMNPLQSGATNRRKDCAGAPRNVFAECDENGEQVLASLREFVEVGTLPPPTVILQSSPGKYQFLWRIVSGEFTLEKVEALNARLVELLGADPACTDYLRYLRIPCLANLKYPERPIVKVVEINNPDKQWSLSEFKIEITEKHQSAVRLPASEEELTQIVDDTEKDLTEARITFGSLRKWGNNGYRWIVTCPWVSEHDKGIDSGTVVLLHNSGARSFTCRHNHCANRNWTDHFRSYLEETLGRALTDSSRGLAGVFAKPAAASPSTPSVAAPALTANISIPYSEDIFHGLSGRIIKKLQPETESHPVGNLLELFAAYGSILGANPYYQIEDTKHFTNLFVVKVGKTSKSRKGTGKARIERIVNALDLSWFSSRNTSGMGSGEGVVWEVRDQITGPVKDKRTGVVRMEVIDPGVSDKRLYISEGEFVGVLAVAGRKDSLLSKIIRDAWDHRPLRNKTKGLSVTCNDPHISISADITREELLFDIKEADKFNGFGNRFLWPFVERQGRKPHGGEEIDWSSEIAELHESVEFARKQKRIFMDRNARLMWERMYDELSEDIPGLVGAVTSRSEAQTIRLALMYAMLDSSDHISTEHLKAARALWQYCEDSARIIFGGVTKAHQLILGFLGQGPKSIADIRTNLFQKNRKKEEIQTDVATLVALGRVMSAVGTDGVERFRLPG